MKAVTTEVGEEVFVAADEGVVGTKGPFYLVYTDRDRSTRYGFYCSNCDTLNNAMDPMGRLVCSECRNTKQPDDWDAVVG